MKILAFFIHILFVLLAYACLTMGTLAGFILAGILFIMDLSMIDEFNKDLYRWELLKEDWLGTRWSWSGLLAPWVYYEEWFGVAILRVGPFQKRWKV